MHRTTSAREPLDSDMHHHFPMIEAGEVDIYNPDRNNRVEVKGRLAHCGEQLTSFLLTRSPLQTLVIGFVVYTLAVVLFALFYFAGGDDCANHEMNFRNAVYISCQTMSTVGYGSIYTSNDYCTFVLLVQSFINVAIVAMITSALFVNFSRPRVKLQFSNTAVIFKDATLSDPGCSTLSFQIVKKTPSSLLNTHMDAILWDYTSFPEVRRQNLKLTQPDIAWMEYGVRVFHHISEDSPLRRITENSMNTGKLPRTFHILATVTGTHACTGQQVMSVFAYTLENMELNRKFVPSFHGTTRSFDVLEPTMTHEQSLTFGGMESLPTFRKMTSVLMIDLDLVDHTDPAEVVDKKERNPGFRQRYVNVVERLEANSEPSSPNVGSGDIENEEIQAIRKILRARRKGKLGLHANQAGICEEDIPIQRGTILGRNGGGTMHSRLQNGN